MEIKNVKKFSQAWNSSFFHIRYQGPITMFGGVLASQHGDLPFMRKIVWFYIQQAPQHSNFTFLLSNDFPE